jgi:hypothetical protein
MMRGRSDVTETPKTEEERRALAIKRVKAKNYFKVHLALYLAINALLVAIWAFTRSEGAGGQIFFWPIFVIVGWGIGVAINGYAAYGGRAYTEDQIQREMNKL